MPAAATFWDPHAGTQIASSTPNQSPSPTKRPSPEPAKLNGVTPSPSPPPDFSPINTIELLMNDEGLFTARTKVRVAKELSAYNATGMVEVLILQDLTERDMNLVKGQRVSLPCGMAIALEKTGYGEIIPDHRNWLQARIAESGSFSATGSRPSSCQGISPEGLELVFRKQSNSQWARDPPLMKSEPVRMKRSPSSVSPSVEKDSPEPAEPVMLSLGIQPLSLPNDSPDFPGNTFVPSPPDGEHMRPLSRRLRAGSAPAAYPPLLLDDMGIRGKVIAHVPTDRPVRRRSTASAEKPNDWENTVPQVKPQKRKIRAPIHIASALAFRQTLRQSPDDSEETEDGPQNIKSIRERMKSFSKDEPNDAPRRPSSAGVKASPRHRVRDRPRRPNSARETKQPSISPPVPTFTAEDENKGAAECVSSVQTPVANPVDPPAESIQAWVSSTEPLASLMPPTNGSTPAQTNNGNQTQPPRKVAWGSEKAVQSNTDGEGGGGHLERRSSIIGSVLAVPVGTYSGATSSSFIAPTSTGPTTAGPPRSVAFDVASFLNQRADGAQSPIPLGVLPSTPSEGLGSNAKNRPRLPLHPNGLLMGTPMAPFSVASSVRSSSPTPSNCSFASSSAVPFSMLSCLPPRNVNPLADVTLAEFSINENVRRKGGRYILESKENVPPTWFEIIHEAALAEVTTMRLRRPSVKLEDLHIVESTPASTRRKRPSIVRPTNGPVKYHENSRSLQLV